MKTPPLPSDPRLLVLDKSKPEQRLATLVYYALMSVCVGGGALIVLVLFLNAIGVW
jgi:hypothetical protein